MNITRLLTKGTAALAAAPNHIADGRRLSRGVVTMTTLKGIGNRWKRKMKRFEYWDAGGALLHLFTKDREVSMTLRKDFKIFTAYWRHNVQVGWQFLVPLRILGILEKKFPTTRVSIKRQSGKNDREILTIEK